MIVMLLSAQTIYINENVFKFTKKRFNKFQIRNDVILVAHIYATHLSNEIDEYEKKNRFAIQCRNECGIVSKMHGLAMCSSVTLV